MSKEKKMSKETKTNTKEDKIKKLVNRYIEELDEEISDEVDRITTGSQDVYSFNDGCERDERDNLYMRMLLSATLKNLLKSNKDDNDDNDDDDDDNSNDDDLCKEIKRALEYAQSEYNEYPEYIQKFFLKNE